jgi:hypothetical protein
MQWRIHQTNSGAEGAPTPYLHEVHGSSLSSLQFSAMVVKKEEEREEKKKKRK